MMFQGSATVYQNTTLKSGTYEIFRLYCGDAKHCFVGLDLRLTNGQCPHVQIEVCTIEQQE